MMEGKNIKQVLHDLFANKSRQRISIQEMNELLQMSKDIEKISEKGLLMVYLTEQLNKHSTITFVTAQRLMKEIMSYAKPQRSKRQGHEDRPRRRKQRRDQNQNPNQERSLEQIAEDSLSNPSNPSNPQAARIAKSQKDSNDSNPSSDNNSKNSKNALNEKDLGYRDQLNKITQGHQFDTTYMDDGQDIGIDQIQRDSSSNSQSLSFGVISNLSEKWKIFGQPTQNQDVDNAQSGKKTRTHHRKGGEVTMTKKKQTSLVFDNCLSLEKTRISLNESFNNESKQMSFEYLQTLEQYKEVNHDYQKLDENIWKEFQKIKIEQPGQYLNFQRPEDFGGDAPFYGGMNDNFDTEDYNEGIQQFTSQQNIDYGQSGHNEQNNAQIHALANMFSLGGVQDLSIRDISRKIKKDEATTFYELLGAMQTGQVSMNQKNPEEFSNIVVNIKSNA